MNKKLYILCLLLVLISCGKNIEDKDNSDGKGGKKPIIVEVAEKAKKELYNALLANDTLLVDYALQTNPHVDYLFEDGETPLSKAIKTNKSEIITKLINKAKDRDLKNSMGETPLTLAIKGKKSSVITDLISGGADLNLKGSLGRTPLVNAMLFNSEQMALTLVKHGADITIRDTSGMSPKQIAKFSKFDRLLNLLGLIENHTEVSYENLLGAIENGETIFIKYLFANYPKYKNIVNQHNMLIDTLELDDRVKRISILEFLLNNGAVTNTTNNTTPLIVAVKKGYDNEVNKLLFYNADIKAQDQFGKNAFFYAIEQINYDLTNKFYTILKRELSNIQASGTQAEINEYAFELEDLRERGCKYLPKRNIARNFNGRDMRQERYAILAELDCF